MKQSFVFLLALATLVSLDGPVALARPAKQKKDVGYVVKEVPGGELYATLETSAGVIIVRLFDKDAPKTVENFVGLARGTKEWKNPVSGQWENRPLYDGTYFHRVLPRFMIQGGDPYTGVGGDPSRAGAGGPGYRFADETQNGRKFDKPGCLAMANSGPDTNGSQFFITEVPTSHLDGLHTIFGEVVSGLELVPRIAQDGDMKTKLVKVTITRGKLVKK